MELSDEQADALVQALADTLGGQRTLLRSLAKAAAAVLRQPQPHLAPLDYAVVWSPAGCPDDWRLSGHPVPHEAAAEDRQRHVERGDMAMVVALTAVPGEGAAGVGPVEFAVRSGGFTVIEGLPDLATAVRAAGQVDGGPNDPVTISAVAEIWREESSSTTRAVATAPSGRTIRQNAPTIVRPGAGRTWPTAGD